MKRILYIALGVFVLCFVLSAIFPAHPASAPLCLTKHEARERYPREHLYWSTTNRCWGNRSVRGVRHFRPRKTIDNVAAYAKAESLYFDKTPSTRSHKVIDLDAKLRECCWPVIVNTDANGNDVLPSLSFADRIKEVPNEWWINKHER